jgi:integrase
VPRQRRGRGDGTVYQRPDGYWVGQINLGWQAGPDGKRTRKRRSVTAKTRKAALDKMRAAQREVDAGVLSDTMTVAQWLDYWLEHVAGGPDGVRARTLQGYRGYVKTWLIPYLGHYRLDKLRPEHVRNLYAAMEEQGKADATRRQAHAILRSALTTAEYEGKLLRSPAALVKAPPVGKNHHKPLTVQEARAMLLALKDEDPNMAARWVCALLLGMRQGECLGLRWSDIDWANGRILVTNELVRITGKGMVDAPPKSDTSKRAIPFAEIAPALYALEAAENRGDYVFYGGKADTRKDWAAWKDLLVKAGVCPPDMARGDMPALHAARGTTASLLHEAGVPDKIISEILGHSSVQITRQAYIHGNEDRHRAAMKALEAFVTPPVEGTA